MKFVYLSLIVIFIVVCLAFATDFDSSHDLEEYHDESVHDAEDDDSGEGHYDFASNFLSSLTKDNVKNHFKDIIRGFSDKGFEECDLNGDKYIDASEVECFITEKMGFAMKAPADKVIDFFDLDGDKKLDADETWGVVENKNEELMEVLPSTVERNMELLGGMGFGGGAPAGPGAGIFY